MADTTYFWHDYETYGANPKIDRACQFAGIRTDADFNIIGEPLMLYCQPTNDVLPHPQACLITGVTPQIAAERGIPEPQFMAQILAELAKPNTCSLGYNTLRFDDEVTRYGLYRNFFDPYAREWQNGCSRWDLIDVVRMTYALRPEGIQWPEREPGVPSFKLDQLAPANGFEHENAHDALADVYATIELAKLVKSKQPKLFAYALENKTKDAVREKLNLRTRQPVLHVSSKFPASRACLSAVMPLLAHPTNKNSVIAYDLRHDPAALLELDAEDIRERMYTPTADLPEGIERVALKQILVNKCPVVAPLTVLTDEARQRAQLDMTLCKKHWDWLQENFEQVAPVILEAFTNDAFEPASDPEQDLYGGFISGDDRRISDEVRQLTGEELVDWEPPFRDNRLHELLFRYRARHFPTTLNDAERDEFENWRCNKLEFAPDGGLTLLQFHELIASLRPGFSEQQDKLRILDELVAWAEKIKP